MSFSFFNKAINDQFIGLITQMIASYVSQDRQMLESRTKNRTLEELNELIITSSKRCKSMLQIEALTQEWGKIVSE